MFLLYRELLRQITNFTFFLRGDSHPHSSLFYYGKHHPLGRPSTQLYNERLPWSPVWLVLSSFEVDQIQSVGSSIGSAPLKNTAGEKKIQVSLRHEIIKHVTSSSEVLPLEVGRIHHSSSIVIPASFLKDAISFISVVYAK